ncbi:hypothetical protein BRC86_04550 [Halobacteriales archaeon QS_3_64_16]|nr:MAG: hypothetical protein BRC86_04550 [Halobacteriales archaeon QS_3_64_16]
MPSTAEKLCRRLYSGSAAREAFALYVLLYTTLTSRYPIGMNVFEADWDLLIVLDACRADALRAVEEEYSFVDGVGEIRSIGSTSKEWIDRTFTESYREEIEQTAYLTANPFANQMREPPIDYLGYSSVSETFLAEHSELNRLIKDTTVSADSFASYDPVFFSIDTGAHEDGIETSMPRPEEMTDRAIVAGRERDVDRMIIHYMQPHQPFLAAASERSYLEPWESDPFDSLRRGEATIETVWGAYLDNLRYVLDQVAVLLRNVDAPRVAITADHGELFGELGLYSHAVGLLHPKLRSVPWVETTAHDTHDYTPTVTLETPGNDHEADLSEQLEALGYKQ